MLDSNSDSNSDSNARSFLHRVAFKSPEESANSKNLPLRLLASKTFVAGTLIVVFWIGCAIFGSSLVQHDPFTTDVLRADRPPSWANWFGTDTLGRDVFSRVIVGSRDILTIAPLTTLLATALGTILGLTTGYFRGWVDDLVMRAIDAFLAVPLVIMGLIALTAFGPSKGTIVIAIAVVFTPFITRTVRAAVLAERELDYIEAARLRDESNLYVLFAEILPNVSGPIIVEFTVRLGYSIFAITTLSFLGFGLQPPSPDWGLQIFENYALINSGIWWSTLAPALAIGSLVAGVNLVSDGLAQVHEE